MTQPPFDAVIAGGGLSGLSLAASLATGAWRDRRVLLVDDGDTLPAAQSWAFWAEADPGTPAGPPDAAAAGPPDAAAAGPLDAVAAASYERIRVCAAGTHRVLPLGRYRYHVVHRADLRRAVRGLLAGCPGFEVRDGRVEAVRDAAGRAETVVDGQVIRSRWAFDSVTHRRAGPDDPRPDARLAFTGWEVRCPRPVFDPGAPLLFDFRTPQAGGSRFVYVLPADPHRALVELTSFVPRRAEPPDARARDAALGAYLRDVIGCAGYEILRTESAVLPLYCQPAVRRCGRVLRIGAAGGLIKASTGYAYQRIQRDSAAIARSLASHDHPFALPAPRRWYRLLDAILLEVLDRDPARLEQAFARLFSANPAERVLAFLDEDTTVADELRLIASLPPMPYLRAIGRRAARRLSRKQ